MEEKNIILTQYELVQTYEILIEEKNRITKEVEKENQKQFIDEYFITRANNKIMVINNLIEKLERQIEV